MFTVTDVEAVNEVFKNSAPRPIRDMILDIYPEATIDCNHRAHSPYDGYVCPITNKTFRAGEFLPFNEPEDNMIVTGTHVSIPTAIDLNGVIHTWSDGTRAQRAAVFGLLIEQSKARDAIVSKHIGDVGSKIALKLSIQMVKGFDGMYGMTWIHVMKDEKGNVVIYKGTKKLGVKDAAISLTAKVKAHEDRDGVMQTIIERPKVV